MTKWLTSLMVLVVTAPGFSQALTLSEVLSKYQETDRQLLTRVAESEEAIKDAALSEQSFVTKLSLRSSGVTVSKERTESRVGVGSTLSLSRATGTAGTISSDLRYGVAAATGDTVDVMWVQSPSLTLRWRQPVLASDKFLPADIGRAQRREPVLDRLQATLDLEIARAARTLEVARLVLEVVHLRMRETDTTVALRQRESQLTGLRQRSELRLAGDTEVRREELAIQRLAGQLAGVQDTLKSKEDEIAYLLDMRSPLQLSGELPVSVPPVEAAVFVESAQANSLRVMEAEAELDKARAEMLKGRLNDSPTLSSTLSMRLMYDTTDLEPRSLSESFSQFWDDEEGDYEISLSLLLDLPLNRGGTRNVRTQRDLAAERAALLERDRAREDTRRSAENLLVGSEARMRSAALAEATLALSEREAEISGKLLALGQSTEEEVSRFRRDLANNRTALWRARADILLNHMEQWALLGRDPRSALSGP